MRRIRAGSGSCFIWGCGCCYGAGRCRQSHHRLCRRQPYGWNAARGITGFRLSHRQAVAARVVALAAGSPAPHVVTFSEVAPVAMMLGSADLLRPWVLATLAGPALAPQWCDPDGTSEVFDADG